MSSASDGITVGIIKVIGQMIGLRERWAKAGLTWHCRLQQGDVSAGDVHIRLFDADIAEQKGKGSCRV